MFNCSDDITSYHNDEVSLPKKEQDAMRDRRDANRKRLKNGLSDSGKPKPLDFVSQGSYAMKTMTQHSNNDYDIDDGVYFAKEDLVGLKGGDMTSLEARQMVRDAVDNKTFKKAPEALKNCVRVYYDAGYHVDIPVYRRIATKDILGNEKIHYELASSVWKRSDARDVTKWFKDENAEKSPDTNNGGQLRRITRDIKKFARSRSSWEENILSGFGITKLVTECYKENAEREDTALYDTMKMIRNRLNINLSVVHPVTPKTTITKDPDDPKAVFLRDKLSDALTWLEPLFKSDCTYKTACDCWDKFYSTDYFNEKRERTLKNNMQTKSAAPAILTSGIFKEMGSTAAAQAAVHKEGGGTYA